MDMIRSFGSENVARKGVESGPIRQDDLGAEDPLWFAAVVLTVFFVFGFIGLCSVTCLLWSVLH